MEKVKILSFLYLFGEIYRDTTVDEFSFEIFEIFISLSLSVCKCYLKTLLITVKLLSLYQTINDWFRGKQLILFPSDRNVSRGPEWPVLKWFVI